MEELLKNTKNIENVIGQFANLPDTILNKMMGDTKFPKYCLMEGDDNVYYYEFEIPGCHKSYINVSKKGSVLTVSGKYDYEQYFGAIKNECNYPPEFSRSITLENDCAKILSADYENGILSVAVSKVSENDTEEVKIN